MVQLLLSEPLWSNVEDLDSAKSRISCLKTLEPIIWSVILSEGRSEARLWFCKALSCLSSVPPHVQCDSFLDLLASKPRNRVLCAQIWQMIFEKRPHKVAPIIARRPYILEKFFKGNPRRILQWFDNFACIGKSEHRKGAKALSQFAFVNRDKCWEELEWRGKHGQSPAVVATKPHYFLDLDVQRTVENFLEYVPEFWSSNELAESLQDGEIFLIDTNFFVDCLIDLMFNEDSKEAWKVIREFLVEETFNFLCRHLLPIIEERDLRDFLKSLQKFHTPSMMFRCFDSPSSWLEVLLFVLNSRMSIDNMLLLNALINHGRQVLRLLCSEDHREQRKKVEDLVSEIRTSSNTSDASLMKECLKMEQSKALGVLGLQSWVIHYRLSEECATPDLWELLFTKNNIGFRKIREYDLVFADGITEESQLDSDEDVSSRVEKKKRTKKMKNKKKRKRMHKDILGATCEWQGLNSRRGSWSLCTDGYKSSWNSVDLPEQLSSHCFSTWLKWLCCQWESR